jgi:hypothetical protein
MNTRNLAGTGAASYTLAGWLSILLAVFAILPKVAIDFFAESLSLSGSGIIQMVAGFHAAGKLAGVYVLLMFKRLLNERHSFHKADVLISLLIACYSATALLGAIGLILNRQLDAIALMVIVSGLTSLISIVYAIQLFKLDYDLSGLLKPYAYSTIAAGLLGTTIVLGQYGRPFYLVSFILLGMILIRAESEPEYL